MPKNIDSIDKIVGYFSMVTLAPFEYKEKIYYPKPLRVSPDITRGLICPKMCGGCCMKFSLDYLPRERKPQKCTLRYIHFNHHDISIMTNRQLDNKNHFCVHLSLRNGRCNIHKLHPFSCDFELIRFSTFIEPMHANQLTSRLYGRGWQLFKIGGQRGALCEMVPATSASRKDTIRKLKRLERWAKHFGIETKILAIIKWLKTNPKEATIL